MMPTTIEAEGRRPRPPGEVADLCLQPHRDRSRRYVVDMAGGAKRSVDILRPDAVLRLVDHGRDPEAIGAFSDQPMVAVAVDDDPLVNEVVGITRSLPCVTVGVARGPVDLTSAPAFDIVVTEAASPPRPWVGCPDIDLALLRLATAVQQAPAAAIALTQLLRSSAGLPVGDALVMESFAYSMLQSGPHHHQWLTGRGTIAPDRRSEPPVLTHRDGGLLTLILNRPHVHNAFDATMRDAMVRMFTMAAADPSVTAISLSGAGRSFCSGGDLTEFGTVADPVTAHLIRTTRGVGRWIHQCADRTTALVHGACIGAGVELPAFAGRVVARPDSSFQLPEVSMGLIPGAGGTVSLPRRIGRERTAYLAITGVPIDSDDALAWGLVDAIEPAP